MDRRHKRKPIYGLGINDADYNVYWRGEDGKQKTCHFYRTWVGMLTRCYREDPNKNKTYKCVSVCDEWLMFSKFKNWMERQPFKGNQLEKDILHKDNKIYSPDTCCFVPGYINSIFIRHSKKDKKEPLGVTKYANDEKGYYIFVQSKYIQKTKSPEEGHKIWQRIKSESYLDAFEKYIKEPTYDTRVADKILYKAWEISLDLYFNRETKEI